MNRELFSGVTVMHALLGVIALAILLSILDRFRRKETSDPELHVDVRCACGWFGQVSRYARRCPKCGGDVND